METSRKIKYSGIDRLILGIAYVLLGLFVLSIVIPLIYVVLASFMDPTVLNNQETDAVFVEVVFLFFHFGFVFGGKEFCGEQRQRANGSKDCPSRESSGGFRW